MKKQTQEYMDLMIAEKWSFKQHRSPDMQSRYFGRKDEFLCFIDVNKGLDHVEFWAGDNDWRIEVPIPFSMIELQENSVKCDLCGKKHVNTEELRIVNIWDKACIKCCEKMKG